MNLVYQREKEDYLFLPMNKTKIHCKNNSVNIVEHSFGLARKSNDDFFGMVSIWHT